MSGPVKDGGPAFPLKRLEAIANALGQTHTVEVEYPGMNLRDWFAGQVMAGLATSIPNSVEWVDWQGRAKDAYDAADAMLAEREKRG